MSIANESDIFQSFESHFTELDQALHDPYITRVIKDARELNELLKTEYTTKDEARDIVQRLDLMWGPLVGSSMRVSGNVSFLTPERELETKYYDDSVMLSKGFTISDDEDGPSSQLGRQIRLSFWMEIPEEMKDSYSEVTQGTHLIGGAEIEQVDLVASGVSFERAKAWLTVFNPEIINEIDTYLYNAENGPVDALLALQDYTVGYLDLDEETKNTTLECIGVYLRDVLRLEDELPYVAAISGRIIVKDEEGIDVYVRVSTERRLMFVRGISLIEVADIDVDTFEKSNTRTEIYLVSTLVNSDLEGDDLEARVPLDSINIFESVRDIALPSSSTGS
jgi:hypothetical protein